MSGVSQEKIMKLVVVFAALLGFAGSFSFAYDDQFRPTSPAMIEICSRLSAAITSRNQHIDFLSQQALSADQETREVLRSEISGLRVQVGQLREQYDSYQCDRL
jgi:hypothetical protein